MDDENNGKDEETGQFLPDNKFWLKRTRHGVKSMMDSPEKLQEACLEYFDSVHDNPLLEEKIGWYEGSASKESVTKMQVMSIQGLCGHLTIVRSTWKAWKKRPDLSAVVGWAENVIETQQIAGATAGLMSASIISRLLGLADKVDHSSKDGSMAPSDNAFDESVKNAMKKAEEIMKNED